MPSLPERFGARAFEEDGTPFVIDRFGVPGVESERFNYDAAQPRDSPDASRAEPAPGVFGGNPANPCRHKAMVSGRPVRAKSDLAVQQRDGTCRIDVAGVEPPLEQVRPVARLRANQTVDIGPVRTTPRAIGTGLDLRVTGSDDGRQRPLERRREIVQ